ncbi:transposase, partial [Thermococci archaeon]
WCKVAPDSMRIGGSGCVNRPVRVRLLATGCRMNSHEAPPVRVG